MDLERRLVFRHGDEVHLTPTEYAVLQYLMAHKGKVITHRNLLTAVWGPSAADSSHMLHVFIAQLRRKIDPDPSRPSYICTEPGVGYRCRAEP